LIALLGLLVLRRQRLTALIGYPVLVVYALAVGATPSVVRASIMVGFALLAPLLGREGDGVTSLSAAGLAILLLNPYAVASVSFQMSFASVAGLLLVTPRAYGLLGGNRKWKDRRVGRVVRLLAGTVSASLGAMVFTAPLGAVYFGYLSFVSPLSNLLVLWLMPVLFGAALLVTLLCVFWPGLAPLAALPALMSRYVLWAAKLTASLKGHGVAFTEKAMVAWLVFVYLLLAVCVISRERRRKYIVAALVAAVTGVCAHALPALTVQGGALTVVAVDVGQGSATLLSSDGATALVDCGSLYWSRGPGNAVADAMESYGWDSLDYVALTHYHADHADGLGELLARVKVEQLLLPEPVEGDSSSLQETVLSLAERYDVPVSFVTTEQTVSLGEATLTAYPPLGDGGTNEVGLTLLCTTGDFDVLITGDMSDSTEALLVDAYTLPDIEVLMVGHHGSKYATSDALLAAVTPEVGIISVGENRYGHPTEEAMGRMTGRDMDIYRTDLQGNIVIRVNG
jgi:competence protein ComEC